MVQLWFEIDSFVSDLLNFNLSCKSEAVPYDPERHDRNSHAECLSESMAPDDMILVEPHWASTLGGIHLRQMAAGGSVSGIQRARDTAYRILPSKPS